MKKSLLLLLSISLFICCKDEDKTKNFTPSFKTVTADTLLQDMISIRALTIDGDKAWYAGSNGKFGWVSLSGGKNFSGVIAKDTLLPEFRAIAQTKDAVFILNAGSPAMLYRISKDGRITREVYAESGEKVFYDSMKFSNDKDGMAMGDPTDGCLSVLVTHNGGDTWTKLPCDNLPETAEDEAAFAASNTNLVLRGDKAWMVSGGKTSRVFRSDDKGKAWKAHKTPIVQGSEMTGIFSVDFYDDEIGFAVGGDYEKQELNTGNKILTTNGGKKWKPVGEGAGFGYASCVQFVPNSDGNGLVTAGPSGIWYSYDRGATWKQVYNDTSLHTLRFADEKTIIAAGQNKIIRLRLE